MCRTVNLIIHTGNREAFKHVGWCTRLHELHWTWFCSAISTNWKKVDIVTFVKSSFPRMRCDVSHKYVHASSPWWWWWWEGGMSMWEQHAACNFSGESGNKGGLKCTWRLEVYTSCSWGKIYLLVNSDTVVCVMRDRLWWKTQWYPWDQKDTVVPMMRDHFW